MAMPDFTRIHCTPEGEVRATHPSGKVYTIATVRTGWDAAGAPVSPRIIGNAIVQALEAWAPTPAPAA